jgi:hypothetical protein
MKIVVCIASAMLVAMVSTHAAGAGNAEKKPATAALGTFPKLEASNLEKQNFLLPDDFAGERNLLLIAFQRRQQENVDTWLRGLKQFESNPDFHYYELPTISKLNPITRWFINRGMRSGIPDREARARTITLYLDKSEFRKALNLPDESQIYAVLVDREGRVYWRTEGDFDETKAAGLRQALSQREQ